MRDAEAECDLTRVIIFEELVNLELSFEVDRIRFVVLTNRPGWTPVFVVYAHPAEVYSDRDASRGPRGHRRRVVRIAMQQPF